MSIDKLVWSEEIAQASEKVFTPLVLSLSLQSQEKEDGEIVRLLFLRFFGGHLFAL